MHEHIADKRDDGHQICNICKALFVNGEWLPSGEPRPPVICEMLDACGNQIESAKHQACSPSELSIIDAMEMLRAAVIHIHLGGKR